jgi:hypothetical protein
MGIYLVDCTHLLLVPTDEVEVDFIGLHSVHQSGKSVFRTFFCSCFQIFIWYLVHCFAITRYRSSSSLVLIHWFFTKLWPLDLEKYHEFNSFSALFCSCFQIFIWYIALPYQDAKFEFGVDPFIFHIVMALGLRKISWTISFPHFFRSCFHIFIWYIALAYQDTDQIRV